MQQKADQTGGKAKGSLEGPTKKRGWAWRPEGTPSTPRTPTQTPPSPHPRDQIPSNPPPQFNKTKQRTKPTSKQKADQPAEKQKDGRKVGKHKIEGRARRPSQWNETNTNTQDPPPVHPQTNSQSPSNPPPQSQNHSHKHTPGTTTKQNGSKINTSKAEQNRNQNKHIKSRTKIGKTSQDEQTREHYGVPPWNGQWHKATWELKPVLWCTQPHSYPHRVPKLQEL